MGLQFKVDGCIHPELRMTYHTSFYFYDFLHNKIKCTQSYENKSEYSIRQTRILSSAQLIHASHLVFETPCIVITFHLVS